MWESHPCQGRGISLGRAPVPTLHSQAPATGAHTARARARGREGW